MRYRSLALFIVGGVLLSTLTADPLAAQRAICESAGRAFDAPPDAFDFLVGQWSVDDDVARVTVTPAFDGKVLEMVWKATSGPYEARAFIGLDEAGRWSQTWVDSSSTPFFLFYHGGIESGVPTLYQTEMYHESELFHRPGEAAFVCARQRFAVQDDESFVYTFELSLDQGENWGVQDRSVFRRR